MLSFRLAGGGGGIHGRLCSDPFHLQGLYSPQATIPLPSFTSFFTFPLPRDAFPPLSRTLWHILVFHSSGKLVQHLFPLPLQQSLAHVCDSHCQGNVWGARSAPTQNWIMLLFSGKFIQDCSLSCELLLIHECLLTSHFLLVSVSSSCNMEVIVLYRVVVRIASK